MQTCFWCDSPVVKQTTTNKFYCVCTVCKREGAEKATESEALKFWKNLTEMPVQKTFIKNGTMVYDYGDW